MPAPLDATQPGLAGRALPGRLRTWASGSAASNGAGGTGVRPRRGCVRPRATNVCAPPLRTSDRSPKAEPHPRPSDTDLGTELTHWAPPPMHDRNVAILGSPPGSNLARSRVLKRQATLHSRLHKRSTRRRTDVKGQALGDDFRGRLPCNGTASNLEMTTNVGERLPSMRCWKACDAPHKPTGSHAPKGSSTSASAHTWRRGRRGPSI